LCTSPSETAEYLLLCAESHSVDKFCIPCRCWVPIANWEGHCKKHLDRLKEERGLFCGFGRRLGLTIAPALCPFCLASDKPLSVRYKQFVTRREYRHHISLHDVGNIFGQRPERGIVLEFLESRSCPHPLCLHSSPSPGDYREHFRESHGIYFRESGSGRGSIPERPPVMMRDSYRSVEPRLGSC
jgi:hypothetical protein